MCTARLLIFPINNELAIMMALNMHRGAPPPPMQHQQPLFATQAQFFPATPSTRHKKRQRRNP